MNETNKLECWSEWQSCFWERGSSILLKFLTSIFENLNSMEGIESIANIEFIVIISSYVWMTIFCMQKQWKNWTKSVAMQLLYGSFDYSKN